jgi:hypothetical protein
MNRPGLPPPAFPYSGAAGAGASRARSTAVRIYRCRKPDCRKTLDIRTGTVPLMEHVHKPKTETVIIVCPACGTRNTFQVPKQ